MSSIQKTSIQTTQWLVTVESSRMISSSTHPSCRSDGCRGFGAGRLAGWMGSFIRGFRPKGLAPGLAQLKWKGPFPTPEGISILLPMHQTMLFFTKKGRCYWLKCYEIPEGDRNSKGRAIQNLLNIESDDQVNAFLRLKGLNDAEFINNHYVVFATKNGTVKKTCLEAYSRPRANGVIAINIVEGDEVVDVRLTNGHNELIIANRNGRAVRFDENEIRTMGRTSTGVRGMRLDEGNDAVVGMIVVNDPEKETVMVVSEQGYGKRSDVLDYRVTKRGGKGVKTLNITDKTGRLVAIKNVTDDNDLMIINQSGIVIRLAVADCRVMGRATQGVRLINLAKKNDVIASVCKVMSSELEASVEEESRSAWAKKSEEIENDTVGAKTAEEAAEAEAHLADEASEAEDTDSGNVDFE